MSEKHIRRVKDMYVYEERLQFIGLPLARSYTRNVFHGIASRYLGK